MKRALFVLLAVTIVAGLTGCVQDRCCPSRGRGMTGILPGSCANCPETCQSCDPCDPRNPFAGSGIWDGSGPLDPAGRGGQQAFTPGPPTGAVTYPYYTVRGPRDFLARNPRPIGP
ncbi:MAG: hypothetical protein A2V98_23685 [Planctomycetes bacterium RBG_16_64_12]|nr:MAG: hypothetical protein A2V98_23685 [Planctomycetes bacterium RBG_16_64_12]